jgi:hypothetical protein
MATGSIDRAVALYEETVSIGRRLSDAGVIGRGLSNLAEALQVLGDDDQDALLLEALELNRETHDRQCEISTLTLLGNSALDRGDMPGASRRYAESLTLCQATGDRVMMANSALMERVAALGLASAQTGRAARLMGASEALRERLGAPIMPYHRPVRDRCLLQLGTQLEPAVRGAALAEGRQMAPDVAVRAALAICEHALSGSREHAPVEQDATPSAPSRITSP